MGGSRVFPGCTLVVVDHTYAAIIVPLHYYIDLIADLTHFETP